MSYIRLLVSLFSFMLTQSMYSMELNLKDKYPSKEENVPKIKSELYEKQTHIDSNNPPSHRKDHKKNLLSLFTRSDAEPTHSSQIKTNHKTLPITLENTNRISPKHSPRKPSPRLTVDISDESPKVSPKVSPRKFITNTDNFNVIEKTKQKNISNRIVSPDVPELPRSRSHSSNVSITQKDRDKPHKRTTKSKSTNDNPSDLHKIKSSKDLLRDQNSTITAGTCSPIEEKEEEVSSKSNNRVKSLSLSDSVVNNSTHPFFQSNSSSSLVDNENNAPLSHSSSSIKQNREYSLGKFFSKSGGTIDNSQRTSPIRSSKPLIVDENNIISAVRSKNINAIKRCINNPDVDPNKQNEFGMTALHYAALDAVQSKNGEIINLLLLDPRIDSSLKNNNSLAACQLIEGTDKCQEIRTIMFARRTLDETINREMFSMLINLHIKKESINDACIKETAKVTNNKILKVESSQGSSELPEEALLIGFVKNKIRHTESSQGSSELSQEALLQATNGLIAEMIQLRIPKDTRTTQILIAAIHEEILALRLNVEIDNMMITESVNVIKKTLNKFNKQSKIVYPPQYSDQDFIFSVIRSYMLDQKIKIKPSFSEMIIPQDDKDEAITLLLFNPYVDTTLKNNQPQASCQLIKGNDFLPVQTSRQLIKGNDFSPKIRQMLSARLTFDETVNREIFIMLINLHIKNQTISNKCIKETVEIIKNTIPKENAHLLPYTTDDFITKMIIHRIPEDSKITQKLITVILEEIHVLSLNEEVDNKMITTSVNTIKEILNKSNKKSKSVCPSKYMDHNFIFSIIFSYIQDQKIKTKPSFPEIIMCQNDDKT